MGYRMALFAWSYVSPFWYNTALWRTDKQTDRYRASIALHGKNHTLCKVHAFWTEKCAASSRLLINKNRRISIKGRIVATEFWPESRLAPGSAYILLWFGAFPSQNCPFPWGDPDLHLIHGYAGPPEPTCQTASRSLEPFLQNRPTPMLRTKYTDHVTCVAYDAA